MSLKSILSTKKLNPEQKAQLQQAGITVTDYNAIAISFVEFDSDIIVDNAIITSQNAAQAVLDKKVIIKNCFCVGEKTQALLEENGQNVEKMKQNASELAKYLIKNHKNEQFWFFCGNFRREEIPDLFKEHNMPLKEVVVYNTALNPQKIDLDFDGILFFSPSGIESFLKENTLQEQLAFCIGQTTADALKPYKNCVIASNPTVESVLDAVIKHTKKK
ncbi:MAG TPA: uroporphyrinogen-III synthase [Flavobacteriaceae bacterium]|nr:uroporphyrinogen-III synthase [Flavobacteriaceae bacterium]